MTKDRANDGPAISRSKVLVVEDDLTVRVLAEQALEAAGFDVALAENGCDGVDAFRSDAPDIVLLDVMMPKNGWLHCVRGDP